MAGQQLPPNECSELCSGNAAPCSVSVFDATTVTVMCQPGCAVGRRPTGFSDIAACDASAIGEYFAEMARLEAASVTAFRILRDELREWGAPRRLVRAAGRAARDEVRHARSTRALARRFGGVPRTPVVQRGPRRSLEAVAIENVVEGCVRETFGALVATRQARAAEDPVVRAAMLRIARDETNHACLSWRVARFLDSKLDATGRDRIAQARQRAARELLHELASEPKVSFAKRAGLPSRAEMLALAAEMQRALWS